MPNLINAISGFSVHAFTLAVHEDVGVTTSVASTNPRQHTVRKEIELLCLSVSTS